MPQTLIGDNRRVANLKLAKGESMSVTTTGNHIRIMNTSGGQTIVHVLDKATDRWVPLHRSDGKDW